MYCNLYFHAKFVFYWYFLSIWVRFCFINKYRSTFCQYKIVLVDYKIIINRWDFIYILNLNLHIILIYWYYKSYIKYTSITKKSKKYHGLRIRRKQSTPNRRKQKPLPIHNNVLHLSNFLLRCLPPPRSKFLLHGSDIHMWWFRLDCRLEIGMS